MFWATLESNKTQSLSNNLLFVSTLVPCLCVEDLKSESKENQWMGVTVNSQGPGGKIVVRMCVFISDHHSQTEQLQFDITNLDVAVNQ